MFLEMPEEPGVGLEGRQPRWRGRGGCVAGSCSHISSRAWLNLGSLCQQRRDVTQSVGGRELAPEPLMIQETVGPASQQNLVLEDQDASSPPGTEGPETTQK